MEGKFIAAYCRVSTDSADQINSYENQISYFEREICESGNTLYKIYADKGLTGTKLNNRPEFEQMLKDAGIDITSISSKNDIRLKSKHTIYEPSDREPKFSEIWIKNTSRFARNILSYEIISHLRAKNVNIYFIEQNINSNEIGQDLLLKFFQMFDEQESRDKSLKVMTGIRESAKKGKLRTNGKLYGYAYLKDENRLEIIEKEADVIRTIFQLYHDGMGVRRILSSLKIRGIKTRKGKDFCLNTLLRILNNEKYAGLNNPLKFDNGVVMQKNGYAKIRDGYEKDVKPSDKVPAIIDVDLFNECKALLNSKVSHSSQKGIYKGITKYASMIKCGVCGSTYYRDSDRGRLFYKCSRKKHEGISVCNNLNVKEELIDNFVLMLAQGGITEVINAQKERATKIIFSVIKLKLQKMDKDRDNEAKQIALQIEFKKQELSRYYELYAQATVQNDILKPLIEKTEIVKQELADAYKEAVKSNEQLKIEILDLLNLHNNILKIDAEKAQYTFDETLDMIEFIEIYGKNGKPSIQAYITKAREIENLTARYDLKYETLSLAECREIINQVAELMNTGDQKRDNVS